MSLKLGVKDLVEEASRLVKAISVNEALDILKSEKAQFIDLRDVRELVRTGFVPGAFHAPRGMLEFWVDPASPYYKDIFEPSKPYLLYCQSGWRSALAGATLIKMGFTDIQHMDGGFTAWQDAGYEIERK